MKPYVVQVLLAVLVVGIAGCDLGWSSGFHSRVGWVASDYFSDPQQIELCQAIEANDLAEIDRLVAAGADVNAIGKDSMTPLLWAFPDDNLPRFEKLLQHGANPNVVFTGTFGTDFIPLGDTVVHMAARTQFDGYLKAVLDHGGDPNAVGCWNETPLCLVISSAPNKKERIQLLLDAGADIDQLGAAGHTPLIHAIGRGDHYAMELFLLEKGADPSVRRQPDLCNFLDVFVIDDIQRSLTLTPQDKAGVGEVEKWLTTHGFSVADARADYQRWMDDLRKHRSSHFKAGAGYKERSVRYAEELKTHSLEINVER